LLYAKISVVKLVTLWAWEGKIPERLTILAISW
jgi:hypothetical protein